MTEREIEKSKLVLFFMRHASFFLFLFLEMMGVLLLYFSLFLAIYLAITVDLMFVLTGFLVGETGFLSLITSIRVLTDKDFLSQPSQPHTTSPMRHHRRYENRKTVLPATMNRNKKRKNRRADTLFALIYFYLPVIEGELFVYQNKLNVRTMLFSNTTVFIVIFLSLCLGNILFALLVSTYFFPALSTIKNKIQRKKDC